MPTIRDARGLRTVHDMGTPPGNPSGPVERSQASAARMADFAAERARASVKREPRIPIASTPAERLASSRNGTARSIEVRQEKGTIMANPARAATGGAAHESVKLPRDRDERTRAVLEAVRTSSSHAEAGAQLGVGGQRIAQFVSDLRRGGQLPADVEKLLRARIVAELAAIDRDLQATLDRAAAELRGLSA